MFPDSIIICRTFFIRLNFWILVFLFHYFPAYAGHIEVNTDVSLKEGWNDNIYLSRNEKSESMVTVLDSGVEMNYETERLKSILKASGTANFYHDENNVDSITQKYTGDFTFLANEKNSIRSMMGFSREANPDRDLITTGFVFDTSRRDRMRFGAAWYSDVNEHLSNDFEYNYIYERYKLIDHKDDQDGNLHTLNLKTKYRIGNSINNAAILYFGICYFDFSKSSVENISLMPGFSWEAAETVILNLNAGARLSKYGNKSDVNEPVYDDEHNDRYIGSATGSVKIKFQFEKSILTLVYDRSLEPSSRKGTATDRDSVLFYSHFQGQNLFYRLDAGYFHNNYDVKLLNGVSVKEQTFWVSPQVGWNFTGNTKLDLTYTWLKNQAFDGSLDIIGQTVFLRLSHRI